MKASDHSPMDEEADETGVSHDFTAVAGPDLHSSPYLFVLVFGVIFCLIDTGAMIAAGWASAEVVGSLGLATSITMPVILGLAAAFLILGWVLRIYPRRRAALEGGEIGPVVRLLGGLFAGALAAEFGENGLSLVELGVWAAWLLVATGVAKACRALVAGVVRHNVGAAYLRRPTVVVGNNAAALALVRGLTSDESSPYRLVGYFDDG